MSVQNRNNSRQAAKKAEKRRLFVEAARKIFSQKGFQATNVTDIVAEVKSGQGTFYYHFKDKQAIFDELLIGFINELISVIADNDVRDAGVLAFASRDRSLENASAIAGVFARNLDLAKLFFNESRYVGGEGMQRIEMFYTLLYSQIEDGLRQGIREGSLRPEIDPAIVARCIVGASERAIYETVKADNSTDLVHVVEQIVDFQTMGILVRKPKKETDSKA